MTNRRGFLSDCISSAFSASEAADYLQKSFPDAPFVKTLLSSRTSLHTFRRVHTSIDFGFATLIYPSIDTQRPNTPPWPRDAF